MVDMTTTTTCRSLNSSADFPDGVHHADNCNGVNCRYPEPTRCPFGGCGNCDDGGYFQDCEDESTNYFGRVDMWELNDGDSYNQ